MQPPRRPIGDDLWRVRACLRDAFEANGRRPRAWHVARFDYARAHTCPNVGDVRLEDVAWIWEGDEGVVALLAPDGGRGEAHLSVAPAVRSPRLLAEMLELAEAELASEGAGPRRLLVWADEDDAELRDLLAGRGYRAGEAVERQYRRTLEAPVEVPAPAAGYAVRALADGLELLERCYASGLAFHDGAVATAVENRADPSWYRSIQGAPLYRRDLDLVAVSEQGEIAGFVTLWFDDVTRSVLVEPLAVVPRHRRSGLGRALLGEGLARAQRLGATLALVGGYGDGANALYEAVFGDAKSRCEAWLRTW
jgi:mycothiol synthase